MSIRCIGINFDTRLMRSPGPETLWILPNFYRRFPNTRSTSFFLKSYIKIMLETILVCIGLKCILPAKDWSFLTYQDNLSTGELPKNCLFYGLGALKLTA